MFLFRQLQEGPLLKADKTRPTGLARPLRLTLRKSFLTRFDRRRPPALAEPLLDNSCAEKSKQKESTEGFYNVTENHGVGGSIPPLGTIPSPPDGPFCCLLYTSLCSSI
jgi:hypothetical protein